MSRDARIKRSMNLNVKMLLIYGEKRNGNYIKRIDIIRDIVYTEMPFIQ